MNRRTRLILGIPVAMSLLGLVACEANRKEDVPHGSQPQPIGSSVRDHFGRQAAKAEADDFVIYQYEWDRDSTRLDRQSHRRFNRTVGRLATEPFDFIVEPSDNDQLDDARRRAIVALVAQYGIQNANERVLVDDPRAEGIYGDEGAGIAEGMGSRSEQGTSGRGSLGGRAGAGNR